MNRKWKTTVLCLLIGVCVLLFAAEVFAAEKVSTVRKVWDNLMLFVNFGIIVFFFIKFAKKPLMGFLRGQGRKIEDDLHELEIQLQTTKSKMNVESEKLSGVDERMEEVRQAFIQIGQKTKEEIVEQAKIQAQHMLEQAQAEANYKLTKAKKSLNDELADIAVALVEQRLRKGVTPEDNEKMISQFLKDLENPEEPPSKKTG